MCDGITDINKMQKSMEWDVIKIELNDIADDLFDKYHPQGVNELINILNEKLIDYTKIDK